MTGNGIVPSDLKAPTPTSEAPVSEPHVHDVLLGRGGLTNHHPGNNWYRCLVKSNRPLYEQSPKHTKLLVSKAIVHHVMNQNPPGRFLDKDKATGKWIPASYDKAVHKTSQALRERDKRNGENDGPVDPPVPAPPRDEELVDAVSRKPAALPVNGHYDTKPPALQQTASWLWRNQKKQKTAASSNHVPSPTPPLLKQSSSLFRFLSFGTGGNPNGNLDHQPNKELDPSMEPTSFFPAPSPFFGNPQYVEQAQAGCSNRSQHFR